MILLCGISSETPLRLVERRLDEAGANYVMFHQRNFESCQITFEVSRGTVSGRLRMGTQSYRLEDFTAVHTRLMDDRCLPELANQPEGSPLRVYCRGFHDALTRWTELTQGLVINRVIPMGSNSSKPYQSQLIRAEGFLVPETLVTSNPDAVREFREKHGRVIYKSVSAVRSIVQTLEDADLDRLDHIRWCPTQFQAFVAGTNVRVHVVGERVYPTAVSSEATPTTATPTGSAASRPNCAKSGFPTSWPGAVCHSPDASAQSSPEWT